MKISVISVVRNDLNGLKKTTASVLSQTATDFEYIILDGGSNDGTLDYIKSLVFKGVWKSEPDKGIYNAMNKAVGMAQGDYVLFMNAGDTFYDKDVLRKAEIIIGEADLYVGHTMEIGDTIIEGMAPKEMTAEYLINRSIYHQSTFIRRTLLIEHPYNETLKICSDWEFFFDRWLHGSSYQQLDFFVSNYYLGGFSTIHKELIDIERENVKSRLMPQRLREYYLPKIKSGYLDENNNPRAFRHKRKLIAKINTAMELPPLQRDLKIARNAVKMFFRDLFL